MLIESGGNCGAPAFQNILGSYGGAHKPRLARWVERGETSEKLSNQTMSFLQAGTLSVAPLDGVSLVGSGFCVETGITGLEGLLGIVFVRSLLEAQSEKHARKGREKGREGCSEGDQLACSRSCHFAGQKIAQDLGGFFCSFEIRDLTGHSNLELHV
ncbi:hypothetical protein TWF970_001176 [Orbilia oligospora]|uniref:Uncharacterized protein n=1 Tax=Orbilia oligospora TaxID=2813651 RepID=A0A7C8VE58_ORBOL|nr:hypothetical protein TWF970_001176 [Orbilia oligospora]